MTKVLIVEDDIAIAQLIEKFLLHEKYTVKILYSGADVIEQTQKWQPDLVILDVMLPGKDGITCCREIRVLSDVPIIILTARVEEVDRIIGLRAGADDYVCKPFSAVELTLRAQRLIQRADKNLSPDGLHLNTETYNIQFQKNNCELTHLEFLLFKLLFDSPLKIFSRDEIMELAYPDNREIYDRAIDSHIKNIRKKIKSLGLDQTVIDSVYGAGYRYLSLAE